MGPIASPDVQRVFFVVFPRHDRIARAASTLAWLPPSVAISVSLKTGAFYASLRIVGKLAAVLKVEPAELLRLPPRRARRR